MYIIIDNLICSISICFVLIASSSCCAFLLILPVASIIILFAISCFLLDLLLIIRGFYISQNFCVFEFMVILFIFCRFLFILFFKHRVISCVIGGYSPFHVRGFRYCRNTCFSIVIHKCFFFLNLVRVYLLLLLKLLISCVWRSCPLISFSSHQSWPLFFICC